MGEIIGALLDYFAASIPTDREWDAATTAWLLAALVTAVVSVLYFVSR